MKKSWVTLFFLILIITAPHYSEAQCAMCKAAVESSQGQANSVAAGINKGILYLMAVPYLLLMFIFRKQVYALWNKLRGKEAASSEEESF
jgi:hypothetical protein